jgi:pimeloyl-ACP methyl ester carboxylesterase
MSSRTPVVFIPALLCDDKLYQDVITTLGESISAQVMSSPHASLADNAADILSRAPDKFVLVGTSYGGNLALAIALHAPERISALWLMGCDPGAPVSGGPDLAASLESTPQAVIDMLAGLVVQAADTESSAEFRAMAARVGANAGAAQARALASRPDINERLGELTMPVLVTWGDEDKIVAPSIGQQMAERLPDAQYQLLEQCGHLPTLERPAHCAALFKAFLAKHL